MDIQSKEKIRILVVDDEESVLDAYRSIFELGEVEDDTEDKIRRLQAKLYSADDSAPRTDFRYEIVYCRQGNEALQAVRTAQAEKDPFAIVFMDVRMPPGPDGVWTAERIRAIDQMVNIVIVTAYSNIAPSEISARVLPLDKLLYMQKPFHTQEIEQFAAALGTKWRTEMRLLNINKELAEKVEEQTKDLVGTNEALEESITKYKETEKLLRLSEANLTVKANDLEGTTVALQQLVQKNERDKKDIQDKVLFSVNEMIKPYLEKLQACELSDEAKTFVNVVESNLGDIVAPFMRGMAYKYFRLTPKEIHIANLIKQGKSTKKISELLDITQRGVEFHRNKIREKIGIKNTKAQLREVLENLEIEFM